MALKQLFDYLTFRDILSSNLGSSAQSILARGAGLNPTTINNWCSSRAGGGPDGQSREKIDRFFKDRNLAPIDWTKLRLPFGVTPEDYHKKLNDSKASVSLSTSPDMMEQLLDLQKQLLVMEKKLLEKDSIILKYKEDLHQATMESYSLKKQNEHLRSLTNRK